MVHVRGVTYPSLSRVAYWSIRTCRFLLDLTHFCNITPGLILLDPSSASPSQKTDKNWWVAFQGSDYFSNPCQPGFQLQWILSSGHPHFGRDGLKPSTNRIVWFLCEHHVCIWLFHFELCPILADKKLCGAVAPTPFYGTFESTNFYADVLFPWNRATPKSSMLVGFSLINQRAWGAHIYGPPQMINWMGDLLGCTPYR